MRITTFNANGIRSAGNKGFYDWMLKTAPDVVCIQELKAHEEQLTDSLFLPQGYHRFLHCAQKKGYSGVGLYTRVVPQNVQSGIGWTDFDSEGRFIRADFQDLSVISIYMPSGSSGDVRQQVKEDMLDRLKPVLSGFRREDREFVICGDINIAHKPIDIRNWKGNLKNSGFLPQERAWMDWLYGDAGYVDAFRILDSRPSQYTWWSNRGQSYANNVGWRLDYQIVTPSLQDTLRAAVIYTEHKFSDHAPLIIDYDFVVE